MVSQEPLATSLPSTSMSQMISSTKPINVNHGSMSYHHIQQVMSYSAPPLVVQTFVNQGTSHGLKLHHNLKP